MKENEIRNRIQADSIIMRRNTQAEVLVNWGEGLLTGRECIEAIIELENVIIINSEFLKELNIRSER